jgi:hypothetical protein
VTYGSGTGTITVDNIVTLASLQTVASSSLTAIPGLQAIPLVAGHMAFVSGLAKNAGSFPFQVGIQANTGSFVVQSNLGVSVDTLQWATVGTPAVSNSATSTSDIPFMMIIQCLTTGTFSFAATASGGSTTIEAGAQVITY